MDVAAVVEQVRGIAAVRAAATAPRDDLEGCLRSITVVRAWLAAAEAEVAGRLAQVASFPEQAIAEASRGSQGEAGRVLQRSGTLGSTPSLAEALDGGAITAGHVDAVTKVAKGLEGEAREALLQRADQMVGVARHGSASDFRRRLEREADRLRADGGVQRFRRQQRATRLRRWVDADGMWCLAGRFDPVTGVRLNARLNSEIEAAFAEAVPEGCPTDPHERQAFLATHALARIIDGEGTAARAGRPEFVVVIQADAPGDQPDAADEAADGDGSDGPAASGASAPPHVDWGLPVEVPWRVLVDLFHVADVSVVIVRNGVVLHAPGQLDLGRTTRLANKAQRRALRALHATCGVPGCEVHFDRCKIHHVVWWRHGGFTTWRIFCRCARITTASCTRRAGC